MQNRTTNKRMKHTDSHVLLYIYIFKNHNRPWQHTPATRNIRFPPQLRRICAQEQDYIILAMYVTVCAYNKSRYVYTGPVGVFVGNHRRALICPKIFQVQVGAKIPNPTPPPSPTRLTEQHEAHVQPHKTLANLVPCLAQQQLHAAACPMSIHVRSCSWSSAFT